MVEYRKEWLISQDSAMVYHGYKIFYGCPSVIVCHLVAYTLADLKTKIDREIGY